LSDHIKAAGESTRTYQKAAADIRDSMFGPEATVRAVICEMDVLAIGFAVCFSSYSTWLGPGGLFLAVRADGVERARLEYLR